MPVERKNIKIFIKTAFVLFEAILRTKKTYKSLIHRKTLKVLLCTIQKRTPPIQGILFNF